jgi:hypothetical protein
MARYIALVDGRSDAPTPVAHPLARIWMNWSVARCCSARSWALQILSHTWPFFCYYLARCADGPCQT